MSEHGAAYLVVEHTRQQIPLSQQRITIGRELGNDIELDDTQASRQHAALVFLDGQYVVQDLGSANGTHVNGRRVTGRQVLNDGDKLRIGQTVLHVRLSAAAAPPPGRRGRQAGITVGDAATQMVAADRAPARARSWSPAVAVLLGVLLVAALATIVLLLTRQEPPGTMVVVRMTATPPEPTATILSPTEAVTSAGTNLPPTDTLPAATEPVVPPSDTPQPSPSVAPPSVAPPTDTPPPPTVAPPTVAPPTATTRPPADPGLIADMETFGTWRRGDEANGTFTQTQEQVHGGTYAGKLTYNWPSAGNDYVVFVQQHKLSGSPNQISAWVYGDGAGHFINVWVRDAGGQTWQFPLGRVQHTGWQRMVAWLDTTAPWPTTHIDGADNGVLDYPVTFRALVMDDVPDGFSGSGTIYVDDLRADQGSQPSPTQPPTAAATPGRVVRFWADDTTLTAGTSTVLHWHVENVRAIYLDGAAVTGPDGQKTVSPAVTTTYRLRVVFAGGEEVYEVTITVS